MTFGRFDGQIDDNFFSAFTDWIERNEKESDRGAVILAAAALEDLLGETIGAFLIRDPVSDRLLEDRDGPAHSFNAKIKLAYVLGLISKDERKELDIIRDIRNKFAHRYNYTMETQEIRDRINNLNQSPSLWLPKGGVMPSNQGSRDQFELAFRSLWIRLKDRPWLVATRHLKVLPFLSDVKKDPPVGGS